MLDSSTKHIESSFTHIKKLSAKLSLFFKVILLAVCVTAACFVVASLFLLALPGILPVSFSFTGREVTAIVVSQTVVGCILWVIYSVFDNIAKGSSPFTARIARRIRWIGWLMLLGTILGTLLSPELNAIMHLPGNISLGYNSLDANTPFAIPVNGGLIIGAVVCFCLSLVFQYGALLQHLSDETI